MNNTLNPCKCDSGTGTGGDASDVVYDGLSVDCLPGLVGQNLATAIKRLGDALCDVESGAIAVTVNPGPPTGGENGDIWFRQQGNVVSVYQHNGSGWTALGDLVMGDTPTLQEVTDEGNTTTNNILLNGANFTIQGNSSPLTVPSTGGIVIGNTNSYTNIIRGSNGDGVKGNIQLHDDWIAICGAAGNGAPQLIVHGTQDLAEFKKRSLTSYIRVSGADALNDDDFVTKRQLVAGSPTYTQDQDVPNTGALSYLNSEYPNAKPGDQVYKTADGSRRTWTCYASGEWSRIDEVIET